MKLEIWIKHSVAVLLGFLLTPSSIGLAQVNPATSQPANDAAILLETTRQRYERYRVLVEAGAIPQQDFVQAAAEYCTALARYESLRAVPASPTATASPTPTPSPQPAPVPIASECLGMHQSASRCSNLQQADLTLAIARTQYQRNVTLEQAGAISRDQLQASQLAYHTAQQNRDRLATQPPPAQPVRRTPANVGTDTPNVANSSSTACRP